MKGGWNMRTAAAALLLALAGTALAAPAPPVGCPTCIQNTATPQNAQVNIGTATIRGTLTASTGTFVNLNITNLNVTSISGSGAALTNLNASQLASGTVPSARVAGAYTGITGVGTLAAGVWNGTAIGTQYGGTGQNWSAVNIGAIPYFSGTGAMTTLAAGASTRLLQANGAGAPSWTAAPTVLGTNVTSIPLANLQTGNLPAAIKATDASLVSVSGSKVSGNIGGDAAGISGTLPLNQLEAGTLAADILAQNLVPSGVPAGTYGLATFVPQITLNNQGIVTNVTQIQIPAVSTSAAWQDRTNTWSKANTAIAGSSWTFHDNVLVTGTLSLSNALGVASGGTGRATLTANALAYGNGTSAIGLLPVLGNGGLVIGTGAAPSTGTLTGTANQVVVTNAAGKITLSVPQDIGTGSSPTFSALTLTAPLTTANGGTGNNWSATASGGVPYFSGAGVLSVLAKSVNGYTLTLSGGLPVWSASSSSATHLSGGTAGAIPYQSAPNATAFLPAIGDGGLVIGAGFGVAPTTGTLTGTANQVIVTRNGAGLVLSGPQDLGTGSSPTFAALTLSSPLTVANGGSGQSSLTANGVLVGNGTGGIISLPAMGATGIITGSGTGVRPSTGTLAGTANQVIVTQTGSNITLSGPQDLGTGSSPSFVTVTANLTGTATNATLAVTATNLGSGAVGQIPYQTGSGATAFLPAMALGGIVSGNGTSAIPSTGTFTGTANQVIITRTNSNIVLSGPQDLGTGSSPSFVTVTAALAGNATTATTATNIAAGGAGQMPYQSASGATAFLPSMAALGIVLGNSSGVAPSTITLAGTANQVVLTRTATNLTMSLPQSINSGATPTFTGTNFSGIPAATALTGQVPIANGGTNLSSAGGTANRVLRTSDGSTFVMGQVIGPDIAIGTIAPSSINQGGAATTNVLAWDGSKWTPTAAASGNVIANANNAFTGSNTHAGNETQLAGSTFTFNQGARPIGIAGRVAYSSGTLGYFSFVMQASTTYNLSWSISIASGTTSNAVMRCTVNGDATAANYFGAIGAGYPNGYNSSNVGAVAYFDVFEVLGGANQVGSAGQGNLQIMTVPHYNIMSMTGTITTLVTPASNMNINTFGGYYKGAGPWTLTCFPTAGLGWEHEAILYEVGK